MTATATGVRSRLALRLALLAFAQLIVGLDYNIVYVALPDIGHAVGFSDQSLQWVVSAYAVGFGGFLLLGGRAADRIGPKRLFVLGLGVYGVASLVGGLATGPALLVAARAAQGLGGALLTPATRALLFIGFAEGPARNRAMAVWGAAGSAGLAIGALLGGVLTEWFSWKAVFFVNVPLAVGAAAVALVLLPSDSARAEVRGGFDVPGAVVATAALSLIVFGLVSGPEMGWAAAGGLGSLLVGGALLGGFVIVERRSRNPLVPLRMLRNRVLVTAMVMIVVFMGPSLAGGYYLFTTYIQDVLGYSALQAGLAFLPLGVGAALGATVLTAPALNRFGIRGTTFTGMLGTAAGTGVLIAGMSTDSSYWVLLPGLVVWGVFGGLTFVALFVAAGSGVMAGEQGVAAALASTAQQIGSAIGLAVIVAVANSGPHGSASDVVDGLRTAGVVAAAATAAAAFLAFAIRRSPRAAVRDADLCHAGGQNPS